MPAGVFSVLPGGADVGEALVKDPLVRIIAFTGSTAAGRPVGALAAQHLKRVHLELGGNSAMIIMDDADLEKAVDRRGLRLLRPPGSDLHDHRSTPRRRPDGR